MNRNRQVLTGKDGYGQGRSSIGSEGQIWTQKYKEVQVWTGKDLEERVWNKERQTMNKDGGNGQERTSTLKDRCEQGRMDMDREDRVWIGKDGYGQRRAGVDWEGQ